MKQKIENIIDSIALDISSQKKDHYFYVQRQELPIEWKEKYLDVLLHEIENKNSTTEVIPSHVLAVLLFLFTYAREQITIGHLRLLIRGLNYWGYYDVAKDMMNQMDKDGFFDTISDNESYILLLLQYAKSQKNKGEINKALGTYKKIFALCSQKDHSRVLTMYVFTSYANFCDDYLLRASKYKTFCEIAYERLRKLDKIYLSNKEKRQRQIVLDTYAKSISKENNTLFDTIYQEILPGTKKNPEIYFRIQLRWIELKIKRLIHLSTGEPVDFTTVYKEIKNYLYEFAGLKKTNNLKAQYIRKLSYYKILRLTEEARVGYNGKNPESSIKRPIEYDNLFEDIEDCMDDLEDISEQSLSLNDRKTYAKARYEMALWNQNWGEKKELSLLYLTDAKEMIFCNSTPITSGLYLKITRELAQMYSDTGKHKAALECYQELYRFIDQIMNHLADDKKALDNHTDEFALLSEEENEKLNNSIMGDYEFLTKSISGIYRQILMTQMESASVNAGYILDSIVHDTKHDLRKIQEVNSILIDLLDINPNTQLCKEQLNNSVDRIKTRLEDFQKNIDNDEMMEFDIGNYSEILLEGMKDNSSYSITIEYNFEEGCKLRFSQPLLYSIYFNVLTNVDQSIKAQNITNGIVRFQFKRMNKVYYLVVEDNCGNFEQFKKVVDSINSNQRYGEKLHGLEIIKRRILYLMNIRNNWILEQIETDICKKRLLIPFAKYKEK